MSFSLRNLVKHVADDVNPFDGPQQAPRAAPPPPASTARPQQTLSVQPAHNATFSTTPFQRAPLPQFKTTVAAPQNLSIGNQVIAPSQTARSGQAPAPIQPTNLAKAKAIDFAGASSAVKGLGEVAHSPDLLRFATPNFIPGVSKYVDPAIKKTADALQSPFNLAHKGIDTQAEQLGLHDNPATPFVPDTSGLEGANRLGNVVGTAASFGATGGIGATRDAVTAARALPSTIKAVPEIAPKVADATRQVVAHTTGLVSPKFAGLNKDQVIMDPAKLDVLKNALNPGSQSDVNLRQEIINGLHQIKNDHGHDFISGSPADRKQRISQFLEQNGEAIPELQKHLDRPSLLRSESGGAKAGDILPDAAFGVDQPATPIGDVLAQKQAQLASNAPRVTTKLVPPSNVDTAISKFPERLLEDNRTEPIHKTLLQNVTHDVKHNKDVLAKTASNIAKNEDAALALAKRGTSTEANATALQLLNKYLQEGSFDKADELVPVISPRFTRQGQETQILSTFSKLQPAGAVRYAARQLEKAASKQGRGKQLEGDTLTAHKNILNTAKDAINQLEAEIKSGKIAPKGVKGSFKEAKTPEQMLADRIKTGVSQKKNAPDPIKDMVNTLHGVAKEVIPEALKKTPRDPMQLIGQAIKDKSNYKDVWEKAQKIVAEKYKDNPHALEELDKYFGSSLARPFSKGQLNRGVQQGLKGTDLSKLVKEHYSKVDETGAELKQKLIEQAGLSDSEATQLSGDIQNRYGELVQARKDSIIKQMFGEKATPEQKSAVDRILTIHNVGALSRDEIRPLVAKKLGLQSLTKEDTAKISGMAETIQRLPEGSDERNKATFEMLDYIHKLSPSSFGKQLVETWRSLLLTAPPTTGGNVVGNAVEALTKQLAVNPVAALFDVPTSLVTGQRSRALTNPAAYAKGAIKGAKNAKTYLKTGFDPLDSSAKYEASGTAFSQNLAGKVADKTSSGIYRFLGAQDQPFRYGAREQALAEQAKVEGINSGLKGAERRQFIAQKTANPDTQSLEAATKEGARSVFGNDTILSSIASKVKQPVSIDGKEVYSGATGEFVVPFSKVPASIATRIIERSPLGYVSAAKDIVQAMRNKGFDQRQFTEKLANASVGSAGAFVVGKELADHNLISLGYPTTDKKEQDRWEVTGQQPYSVKIGGTWQSLNYIQPFGSVLAYGAAYSAARKKGASIDQAASQAAGEASKSVTSQSFLQGVSGALNAVQTPEDSAGKYLNSAVGGFVPNLVKRFASATDSVQRQTNNAAQAVEAGIPGLRSHLLPKQTVYGKDLPRSTDPVNSFLNPLKPSNISHSTVIDEVNRLKNSDPTNKDLEVTPTPVQKTISVEGQQVNLTNKQRYDLQKQIGQETQKNWDRLIKTPTYQALSDVDKANALNTLRTATTTDAQRAYVTSNSLAKYNKPATPSVIKANQGNVEGFAKVKGTGSNSGSSIDVNPKIDKHSQKVLNEYNTLDADTKKQKAYKETSYDYKVEKAKYDNDLANGKLSTTQKIKKQDSLAKAEVGSSFTKDTRELYELNKDDIAKYVENDPDGKAIAAKVIAYDQSLTNAGLQAKDKFKNGLISYTASSAKGRTAAGSKKATSDYLASLKSGNTAASQNQKALLNLVKGAKVTGAKRKLNVSSVALKKQTAKKQKVRVA